MSQILKLKKGESLYDVLGVQSTANDVEIAKAYRNIALRCHPDRVASDERAAAEKQFKRVGFVYAVLKDPARRKKYDKTGVFDEDSVIVGDVSISDFCAALFDKEVTGDMIDDFSKKYAGSEKEKKDLTKSYLAHKGEFLKMLEDIDYDEMNPAEEDRLGATVDKLIAKGQLKATAAWKRSRPCAEMKKTKEYKARWKARHAEVKVAEKDLAEMREKGKGMAIGGNSKKGSELALRKDIIERQQKAIMDAVMKKFGFTAKQMADAEAEMPEIDDAAFEKKRAEVRKRMGLPPLTGAADAAAAPPAKRRKKQVRMP